MDVLLEIHDRQEMERALAIGADIIGINHRNLDTLIMDLSLTAQLAPLARSQMKSVILVAESGIENPAGRKLVDEHVDAVLVGTAFMESNNIGQTWLEIFE
jgi:indole-3-glycerol phosphate synthase